MCVKIVSRPKQSICASSAYRAAEKIQSNFDGKTYDYTAKRGVDFSTILLPENCPERFKNRNVLCNEIDAQNKGTNVRLAREIEFSLPIIEDGTMIPKEDYYEMALSYIQDEFVSEGMIADVSFHKLDTHNPHVHVLLSLSPIDENGIFAGKGYKQYLCENDEGVQKLLSPEQFKSSVGWEKIYNFENDLGERKWMTKSYAKKHEEEGWVQVNRYPKAEFVKNPVVERWDSQVKIEEWRANWAKKENEYFIAHNFPDRVSHLSYKRQGLDLEPTIHAGKRATAIENRFKREYRKGVSSKRYHSEIHLYNIAVKERNKQRQLRYDIQAIDLVMEGLFEPARQKAQGLDEEIARSLEKLRIILISLQIKIRKLYRMLEEIKEQRKMYLIYYSDISSEQKDAVKREIEKINISEMKLESDILNARNEYENKKEESDSLEQNIYDENTVEKIRNNIREEMEQEYVSSDIRSEYRRESERIYNTPGLRNLKI